MNRLDPASVSEEVDTFIDEYLRVNADACE